MLREAEQAERAYRNLRTESAILEPAQTQPNLNNIYKAWVCLFC